MIDIKISNLRVRSFSTEHLDVYWELEKYALDPYSYEFYIERSGSPEGPFDTIAGPMTNTFKFRDVNVPHTSRWANIWYRVKIVNGDEVEYSKAACLSMEPSKESLEIMRNHFLVLKEANGLRCLLFIKRKFGFKCPECFNPVSKRTNKSNCRTCFDTGYVGGYFDPIMSFVQIDPSSESIQRSSSITLENQNATARTIGYPLLGPEDIIVDPLNNRWKINVVTPIQQHGFTIRQEMQIHKIPTGSIEHAIPIKISDEELLESSFLPNLMRNRSPFNHKIGPKDIAKVYGFIKQ